MILAAHQPQYFPWLGYLDKIVQADVFLVLDDVQYKKNEWQNRNRIKSAAGWQWLTVPVRHRHPQRIREVVIDNRSPWPRKHREALRSAYARAPYYEEVLPAVSFVWERGAPWAWLHELNLAVIRAFLDLADIRMPIHLSSQVSLPDGPDARLIEACRAFGADSYLAGAGGRAYMDLERFERAGIRVRFQEFEGPVYPQLHGGFIPNLSAIDYFVHCGAAAARAWFANRRAGS